MDILPLLQGLKDRIRKSETEEALDELARLLAEIDQDLLDESYALQQQMNLCQQQSRLNLIDYKEFSLQFSNISFSTLRLITVATKLLQVRQNTAVPSSGISVSDNSSAQPVAAGTAGESPDLLQSGLTKIQAGDYAGAMNDLTTCLENNPQSWEAKYHLAGLYESLGMWEEAVHWYTETLHQNPKNATALNNRGTIRMDQLADYERAFKDFHAALLAEPGLLTARFNRGLSAMHLSNYAQAVADMDDCIEQEFQTNTAAGLRGVCRVHTQDYEGAMADLKVALQADPENASYWGSYGLCQYHTGNYPDAIEFMDKALSIDARQPEMQTVRGIAYYFLDQYDPAEKDFREVIRQNPDYAHAWFFLGLVQKMRGNYKEAVHCLSEACARNPDLAEAYAILGVIAFEQKQYDEAIQFCERALQSDPEQETARDFLQKARAAKSGGLWNKLFGN